MAKILEVIVTSVYDAIEAQAGGADRLELVRNLEVGGLTPTRELVQEVLAAVELPVRVMLRETPTMFASDPAEVSLLQRHAEQLSGHGIDGIVAGFLKERAIDIQTMAAIRQAAPQCAITFHRAFDEIEDRLSAVDQLKALVRVDRILTSGGDGEWSTRRQRLLDLQEAADPEITVLVGAGLCREVLADLKNTAGLKEVHIGRAARVPQSVSGVVDREAVRRLKSIFP